MEIQLFKQNATDWERRFAWLPKVISEPRKETDKKVGDVHHLVTTIIWLQPYYRRVEIQGMTGTWFWRYATTIQE